MSGLALIAKALGADVTGSDRAPSSYTARLVANGIEPSFGHARENVPAGAEVVYSSAIGADNPERGVAGRELHRADLLAEIASLRRCLAVTGTHGKTTTAAMAVHALAGAGLDPSYVVGGELRCTGSNAGWGSGDWIVIEADESDRSLLKLDPEIAVLTNAELDHHATYTSLLDLERTLAEFMARVGAEHAVVWDRPRLRALCPGGGVPFDAPQPQLGPEGSRFQWHEIEVRLSVPGAHNAVNAAGALTACALAGADPHRAAAALAGFQGRSPAPGAAGCLAGGRAGLRRLLAQPDQGRGRDRRRPDARANPAGGGLSAAPLFADACAGARVRRGARRRGLDCRAYRSIRRARTRPTSPASTATWSPSPPRTRPWADRWPGCRASTRRGRCLDAVLRDGDVCLVMGAGDIDSLARSLVV